MRWLSRVSRTHRPALAATSAVVAFVLALLIPTARALENTWIYAVQATAAVHDAPLRVEIHWPADEYPIAAYTVSRRRVGESEWGNGIVIDGGATSFADGDVERGQRYEYRIVKHGIAYTGYGYVCAAVEAPLVEDRGTVVLVVDQSVAGELHDELLLFEEDLVGDGWTVARKDVAREERPAEVKAQIKAEYDADPGRVKALILFGHVPVVRSGRTSRRGRPSSRTRPTRSSSP